jgi:hypothetical protein
MLFIANVAAWSGGGGGGGGGYEVVPRGREMGGVPDPTGRRQSVGEGPTMAHGVWEQGRNGGPGTWAMVGEHGSVALGWPKGIVSFSNYLKTFK